MRSLLLLVMSFALSAPASAEDWPQKPIKMVVPFGPGSASDVLPRIVFEPLQAQLGQAIVIENRAGAGGTIGAIQAARSQPDGYTLLVHSSGLALAPALYPNLGFKPDTDLVAIAMIGSVPNVLIVPPSKGIKTIGEFVTYARANPGKLSFASSGVGSALHLSAERFRVAAGFEAVHVPFKSGSEAMTEVITARVDYFFAPLATVLPFIREGQVVALAVVPGRARSSFPMCRPRSRPASPIPIIRRGSESSDPPAFRHRLFTSSIAKSSRRCNRPPRARNCRHRACN